jgi:hypothetical protein
MAHTKVSTPQIEDGHLKDSRLLWFPSCSPETTDFLPQKTGKNFRQAGATRNNCRRLRAFLFGASLALWTGGRSKREAIKICCKIKISGIARVATVMLAFRTCRASQAGLGGISVDWSATKTLASRTPRNSGRTTQKIGSKLSERSCGTCSSRPSERRTKFKAKRPPPNNHDQGNKFLA